MARLGDVFPSFLPSLINYFIPFSFLPPSMNYFIPFSFLPSSINYFIRFSCLPSFLHCRYFRFYKGGNWMLRTLFLRLNLLKHGEKKLPIFSSTLVTVNKCCLSRALCYIIPLTAYQKGTVICLRTPWRVLYFAFVKSFKSSRANFVTVISLKKIGITSCCFYL